MTGARAESFGVAPEELPVMFRPRIYLMTVLWLEEVPLRSPPPPKAAGWGLARRAADAYSLQYSEKRTGPIGLLP